MAMEREVRGMPILRRHGVRRKSLDGEARLWFASFMAKQGLRCCTSETLW